MRKLLILSLACVAGIAAAQHESARTVTATIDRSWSLDGGFQTRTVTPGALYSNVTTYTNTVLNGGTLNTSDGSNFINDDIHTIASGSFVAGIFRFTMFNNNTTSRAFNPFIGFYNMNGDGTRGSLITYINFNAITIAAGGASTISSDLTSLALVLPKDLWISEQFWKGTGASSTLTVAQLNNCGMLIANPVDVGTSADLDGISDGATDTITQRTSPFAGAPAANYGFELNAAVPEPAPFIVMGLGLVGILARRRRK